MLGAYVAVFITAPSREEAEKIAKKLIEEKLAACVNIASEVKSFFWWKEKLEEAEEALLIIKTRLDRFQKLIESVKQVHSYTVPEMIAMPIIAGNESYLEWIDETVGKALE